MRKGDTDKTTIPLLNFNQNIHHLGFFPIVIFNEISGNCSQIDTCLKLLMFAMFFLIIFHQYKLKNFKNLKKIERVVKARHTQSMSGRRMSLLYKFEN
jgi:hypothetical protein